MSTAQLLAIAAAMGWASGLRLYAVVFLTGAAGFMGWVVLPDGLQMLAHPAVLMASGLMFALEFFVDKIPGLDTVWDVIHTFIRIPAGAALAAATMGADASTWSVAMALLGGSLAASAHLAKTSTRAAVNTSPEPFSNIGLSLLGDAAVPSVLWLAWHNPLWLFVTLAIAVVLGAALVWTLMRFLRALWVRYGGQGGRVTPRGTPLT